MVMEMTMTIRQKFLMSTFTIPLLGSGIALAVVPGSARAEELSAQQIIDGLNVSKTRGLSAADKPALTETDLAFVKRVRGCGAQISNVAERDEASR
jgi:hypothetical protein